MPDDDLTTLAADATVIRLPTAIVSIVGRWAVDGEDDVPAVHALQDALTLSPSAPGAGLPAPGEGVSDDLAFWEELRVLMRAFPPSARDRAYQERFAPLGLLAAESPYPMPGGTSRNTPAAVPVARWPT